jgi:hypothetical protein
VLFYPAALPLSAQALTYRRVAGSLPGGPRCPSMVDNVIDLPAAPAEIRRPIGGQRDVLLDLSAELCRDAIDAT